MGEDTRTTHATGAAADQRREDMLRAALEVISERGFPDSRIADVAERAGVRDRFGALATSHRREFVRWVEEAKRPETRQRRIDGTCAMVGEGRTRN